MCLRIGFSNIYQAPSLIKPSSQAVSTQPILNLPTTSTMRRFTEVLLLVACTLLPSLLVNGLQDSELLPTVNYKPQVGLQRRNTVIRGLLVSRQGLCNPGFFVCEAIGCCPTGSSCCMGLSLPPTILFLSIAELKFLRWQLLCIYVSISNYLQVSMV
jgi:hypothetical protein